ncbi:MAG TPA: hypothetical protein VGT60_06990 [Candidatus Limnocylindria bacterium]|nr:hypothetical protein [Candidatus Limnocylindria bacterium]
MRLDRIFAAAFVVLVSTAIVGFSAGDTSASFTGSTTNPGQSWNTSNVAAPASETATPAIAGRIDLAWPATTTPPNGHTVTYLVLRNGVQIGATASLAYSDTPPADGTYTYTVQTKIAQGAGFFTSPDSPAQSPTSDRTAPAMSATCNGGSCAGWFNGTVTVVVSGNDGTGVGMGTATTNVDGAGAATSAAPRTVTVSGQSASHSVVYSGADAVGNASGNTTASFGIDLTAPTAAGGVNVATGAAAGQLNVSGTSAGTDALSGVAGYRVYYKQAGASCAATPYTTYTYFAGNPPAIPLVLTGLTSGKFYCAYAVTVDNAGNLSVASNLSNRAKAR